MFEIGATLREARERRHLTYEQVEAEIKIRAKYLRALEEEEFDSLPSGTYVRGFLRAYASYLGLDGRLFVDEYASRFGTRHDDELFRRRRERPMTQRRESSSAVLVALIAVVAIGVLFFVAWRFGPGEATSPAPERLHRDPHGAQRQPGDRGRDDGDRATDTTARRTLVASSPCICASTSRRTRGHVGQDHAPLDGQGDRPEADRMPAATWAAASCRTTRASRSRAAIPGNVSARRQRAHVRAHRRRARLDRHGRHAGPARRAGHDPAAGRRRAAVTAGRPAAALLVTGQELLLGLVADANTRFLARELDAPRDRAAARQHRRRRARRDRRGAARAGRSRPRHHLGRARADARRPHRRGGGRGRRRRAGARRGPARDDRRHHRRRSRAGAGPIRRSIATATASRRSCRAARR